MFQETHGSPEALARLQQQHSNSHHMVFSASASDAAGGVALFISKDLVPQHACLEFDELVRGRVILGSVRHLQHELYILNVHNHRLSASEIAIVRTKVSHIKEHVSAAGPVTKLLIIGGDFNFLAPGETGMRIGTTGGVGPALPTSAQRHAAVA